jgi:hypothetical protein
MPDKLGFSDDHAGFRKPIGERKTSTDIGAPKVGMPNY